MTTPPRPHPLTTVGLAAALALCIVPAQAQQATQNSSASDPLPFVVHVPALLDSIDIIAGHRVQLRDARVLEVLEPRAILVEANTHYRTISGQRDRVLVFVAGGSERNLAQFAIGAPVVVEGVARTMSSIRATNEVPWPAGLDSDDVKELEIRGAVVGASLRTAEGTPIS
jgi:hypothetical protein